MDRNQSTTSLKNMYLQLPEEAASNVRSVHNMNSVRRPPSEVTLPSAMPLSPHHQADLASTTASQFCTKIVTLPVTLGSCTEIMGLSNHSSWKMLLVMYAVVPHRTLHLLRILKLSRAMHMILHFLVKMRCFTPHCMTGLLRGDTLTNCWQYVVSISFLYETSVTKCRCGHHLLKPIFGKNLGLCQNTSYCGSSMLTPSSTAEQK
jgi:hypothetical protein